MQSHVKVVLHNLLWDAVNESVANIQLAALHNNSVIQFSEVLKFFRGVSNATPEHAAISKYCDILQQLGKFLPSAVHKISDGKLGSGKATVRDYQRGKVELIRRNWLLCTRILAHVLLFLIIVSGCAMYLDRAKRMRSVLHDSQNPGQCAEKWKLLTKKNWSNTRTNQRIKLLVHLMNKKQLQVVS